MNRLDFERLIAEQFPEAVPEQFRDHVKNVAFLVEEEPSRDLRREEQLKSNETLLGLYRGIPHIRRGDHYGIGPTVPDIIVLFRLPIHNEAEARMREEQTPFDETLRQVVRETIWHEVAHYLGLNEQEVRSREHLRNEKRREEKFLEETKTEGKPLTEPSSQPGAFFGALQDAFTPSRGVRVEEKPAPPTQPMEPIELDTETPELIEKMHQPLVSPKENFSTVDPEGDGTAVPDPPYMYTPRSNEPPDNLPA